MAIPDGSLSRWTRIDGHQSSISGRPRAISPRARRAASSTRATAAKSALTVSNTASTSRRGGLLRVRGAPEPLRELRDGAELAVDLGAPARGLRAADPALAQPEHQQGEREHARDDHQDALGRVVAAMTCTTRNDRSARAPGYTRRMVERVLLASPRGYCAGVERAVETVERALELYGPPVYVRKQIVHNAHVVRELEQRGAVFVDEETEVPAGETVVLSAHGVAPTVYRNAESLGLKTIDATCPLVTKVHVEARRYAAQGYTIVLIGHAGHEEVVGTMGEAPEATVLVQSVEDAEALDPPPGTRLAYLTQTTLSVDETSAIITTLRRRFPDIHAPKKEDICYATSNRQWAVKEMLPAIDLLLVIGSRNSSNSNRLVEVARAGGVAAHLIDDETDIDEAWLDGVRTVGLSSGASAPETPRGARDRLVPRARRERVEPFAMVDEDVTFRLPVELRRELKLADAQRA